jgi:ABC-2 type transport system permease protein
MDPSSTSLPATGILVQLALGITKRNYLKARADIVEGWRRKSLWGTMGLQEIRQRYRRSKIGPFWLTLSMGIMVLALGTLYGTIFGQELSDYLPYLSAGFVIWGLISGVILDGVSAFIQGEGLIKQLPAPLSIHIYRVGWTNLIIFAHNIVIFFLVSLWYGKYPGWSLLLVPPAILVILLNGIWIGLLFGLLSARFRDIPQIVGSVVQVMFFITPVMWKMEMLPGRAIIVDVNPFYYLVEIVRAPLMGSLPSVQIVLGAILITLAGWGLAMLFYTALRWRLPYWV